MHRQAQPGKRPSRQPLRRLACALCLSVLGTFTGCQMTPVTTPPAQQATGDPLVGEMHPKGFTIAPGGGSGVKTNNTKSSALPPYPAATEGSSLAGMSVGDPLLGTRGTLAINENKGTPIQATGWHATPSFSNNGTPPPPPPFYNQQPADAPPGVSLLKPQPIVQPLADAAPTPPLNSGLAQTNSFASPPPVRDYDYLQGKLKERKVIWQRQETFADGYKFICAVQHPTNPNLERQYEAVARDYRAAIGAVLEQMEQQR